LSRRQEAKALGGNVSPDRRVAGCHGLASGAPWTRAVEIPERKRLIIAIDGPSGAGKSTVGKALARRLGYTYIDTGAMYRTVALKAKERSIDREDEKELFRLALSLHIAFSDKEGEPGVLCDGEDVTEAIRSPHISLLASDISKKQGVREALVQKQREMGRGGGVVLEGRDIGTVVFPNAEAKFYLDAKPEERAKRRFEELVRKQAKVELKETLEEVVQRDTNDMTRAISPLRKADDAVFIDSTQRSVEEVVEEMARVIALRAVKAGLSEDKP
jgi:cytidylate kinase